MSTKSDLIKAVRERAKFAGTVPDEDILGALFMAIREGFEDHGDISTEWEDVVVRAAIGHLMTTNLGDNPALDEAVEKRKEKSFGDAILRIMALEAQGQYPEHEELEQVVEWLEGMLTSAEAHHVQRLRAQKQAVHMGIEAFESQMQVRFGRTLGMAIAHRLMRPRDPDPPHVPVIRITPADRPE